MGGLSVVIRCYIKRSLHLQSRPHGRPPLMRKPHSGLLLIYEVAFYIYNMFLFLFGEFPLILSLPKQ